MNYIFIAFLGGIGAAARYFISSNFGPSTFPYSTLFINLIGCFLLAVIVKFLSSLPKVNTPLVVGLSTGLIGSFTTFSSFSVENARLILDGLYFLSGIYMFLSLIGGFLSASLGVYVSNKLLSRKELKEDRY